MNVKLLVIIRNKKDVFLFWGPLFVNVCGSIIIKSMKRLGGNEMYV
jgi:hypothetical protein